MGDQIIKLFCKHPSGISSTGRNIIASGVGAKQQQRPMGCAHIWADAADQRTQRRT